MGHQPAVATSSGEGERCQSSCWVDTSKRRERRDKARGQGVVPAPMQSPRRFQACALQGACTRQVPSSSLVVLRLPGATRLVAPRAVSLAPAPTPLRQADWLGGQGPRGRASSANSGPRLDGSPFQSFALTQDKLRALTGIPEILWNLSQVPT